MKRRWFTLSVVALVMFPIASRELHGARRPNTQAQSSDASDTWAREHYASALDQVFGNACPSLTDSEQRVRWLVCIRVVPSGTSDVESALSLQRFYDGKVAASATVAKGSSVFAQLRELHRAYPTASAEELARHISVERRVRSSEELAALRKLADELEEIRLSPVLADQLMMDATKYEFYSESLYGNQLRLIVYGPGSKAPRQPHPLLSWAESLRQVLGGS